MKPINTIPEAIDQLEKDVKYYFDKLGWKNIPIEKQGEFQSDEPEDSTLRLIINGWIIVTPFITKEIVHCVGGAKEVPAIHFAIEKEILLRSSDRDDPDEWDIVGVAEDIRGFTPTTEKIILTMIEHDLESIGEQLDMEELAHEEEAFSKLEGI